ncbi:MAG: MarR family transcriptional regulator [Nitriliruptorales bacterium]|nr:MarR family transcriptional regulator [Nitriliruptorales bacterium]
MQQPQNSTRRTTDGIHDRHGRSEHCMYHANMPCEQTNRLERLDVAFGRLRRLWESPQLKRRFLSQMGLAIDPAVVRTLRGVRECGDEAGVSDVALVSGIDASTASRLVDHAVALGYLSRSTAARDRRRTVLTITDAGANILERALRVREELLSELTGNWPEDDVTALADLLERFAQSIAEMETRP